MKTRKWILMVFGMIGMYLFVACQALDTSKGNADANVAQNELASSEQVSSASNEENHANNITNDSFIGLTDTNGQTFAATSDNEELPDFSLVEKKYTDWQPVLETKLSHTTYIEGFLDETFGVSVGYSGEIHYTNDAGVSWPKAENASMCRFCLDIVNDKLVWCGGNGGHVRVSKDGGKTWDKVTDISLGTAHSNIDFLDETIGWVANDKRLAKTNDGGETWEEVVLPEGMDAIATLALSSPEIGYLFTISGQVYKTLDGGESFTMTDIGLSSYDIIDVAQNPLLTKQDVAIADMAFPDEQNGIIVFSGIRKGQGRKAFCARTNDGGETWLGSEITLPDEFSPTKVFLTADGNYLTLGSKDKKLVVFKYQK